MLSVESIPASHLNRTLGALQTDQNGSRFCVWSPTSSHVQVDLVDQNRQVELQKTKAGYHVADVEGVTAGDRYFYRFDESPRLPDPASRYQIDGVHGPSVVGHPAFDWSDQDWRGIPREELVIYELHIGTFTDEGTFESAIERLDELVDLGINAIELMPVADAAGRWNWGYDGVCLFAPNRNYGTPEDLKRLVDAAHRRGLAVILDVVYNHLGPEGNYLSQSGPYLSQEHHTVWGSAPNFDDPQFGRELRRFFAANAVYWFDEFHFDALRIDAIHCMIDNSDRHVVHEISEAVHVWASQSGRPAMLIAESNVYDPEMLRPLDQGGYGFAAQWADDLLHSVFAILRPGERLSHRHYHPHADLDQVLRMGYVHSGTFRQQRGRCPVGPRVDTTGLIWCIQNHDFIGNHPLGKRLHQITSVETQRAAAALLILAPAIPMLFMGEEFACERPFAFFVDFGDNHLRQAVVEGRMREYPQHDWSGGASPVDPAAFYQSKLGPADEGSAAMRAWYQALIVLRKRWQARGLLSSQNVEVQSDLPRGLFVIGYRNGEDTAAVVVRLSQDPGCVDPVPWKNPGRLVLDSRQESLSAAPADEPIWTNHAKLYEDFR